jgi:general secretion pathway protein N
MVVLLGAVAGDDDGLAILLDETTNAVVRLKVGESYSGWTLISLKARSVTMRKGNASVGLTLLK